MAHMPEIKIQLDEEGIKAQIEDAIGSKFHEFSMRLRIAADALDGGQWLQESEAYIKSEYDRGFQAGKKAASE